MTSGRGSRHVAIVAFGNFAAPLVALITAPLLAQGLGVAGRGELAAATAPLLLAATALTLGLPDAATHFTARYHRFSIRPLWVSFAALTVVGLAGSATIALLGPKLSGGDAELRELIQLCGLALTPALWVGLLRGIARGQHKWWLISLEQYLTAGLKLVGIAALLAWDAMTPLTAALLLSGALFVAGVIYIPIALSAASGDEHTIRSVVMFGVGVWPGALAGVVLARLDQTLILPLSSAAALGVYAVAVSIADAARAFNIAVRDVMFARQSSVADTKNLALASRISTIITLALSASIVVVSYWLVPLLFGEGFAQVPTVITILLIGAVVGNPGSVVAAGLSARGRPGLRSLAIGIGVVINLLTLLALVPQWGALGAAVAASVANATTGWLVIWFAKRTFGISPLTFIAITHRDLRALVTLARDMLRRR